MSNAINELAGLNFDNLKWITFLRNQLCETGTITDNDLDLAFDYLFDEEEYSTSANIPNQVDSSSSARESILYRLSDNKNVGGVLDDQEIIFSPYFTLVFGKNGTGKSTYYKVLKDAFHSSQDIRPNIYAIDTTPTSANLSFTKKNAYLKQQRNGSIDDFESMETINTWQPGQTSPSKIKFCDQSILQSSLSRKDAGWNVDKFKLGYYDVFREKIEAIESKVAQKVSELDRSVSTNISFLVENLKNDQNTGIKYLLNNNTPEQKIELLEKLLVFEIPEDFNDNKEKLQRESNITISDVAEKNELIKTKITSLKSERHKLELRSQLLRKIDTLRELINNAISLKSSRNYSAFDKYDLLFTFSGNTDKDNSFIQLIKSISETALKYGRQNYPEDIDKCFYCNQNLTEESKNLILELHKLVNSSLEDEIGRIEKQIKDTSKWIEDKILNEPITNEFESSVIQLFDISTRELIDINSQIAYLSDDDVYSSIKNCTDNLKMEFPEVSELLTSLDFSIHYLNSELSIQEDNLVQSLEKMNTLQASITKSKNELLDLEDLDFVVKNRVTIQRSKDNLASKIQYGKLSFQGHKLKVSRDKSRVEGTLVRSRYSEIFDSYTQKFDLQKRDLIIQNYTIRDGQTKIEPKITGDQGTHSVNGILSEGEAKIYALCDWLTELELDDVNTLIFDDPINSLDQRNIERTASLISELSSKYQVVVFTHNFEFYDKLVKKTLGSKAIEKVSCEICKDLPEAERCLGKSNSSGILRKCGNYFKIQYTTQPGKALKDLDFFRFSYEQRIEELKNRIISGNQEGLSTDIRATINNYFENHVLADIKRDVFKGEDLIHYWAKFKDISDADYNKLMAIHNRLSGRGVHEPSIEIATELDILDYKNLMNEFITVVNNYRGNNLLTLLN